MNKYSDQFHSTSAYNALTIKAKNPAPAFSHYLDGFKECSGLCPDR